MPRKNLKEHFGFQVWGGKVSMLGFSGQFYGKLLIYSFKKFKKRMVFVLLKTQTATMSPIATY